MKRNQRFFWKNLGLGILILVLAVSFFKPAPAQAQVDNGTWVVKTPSASGATNFTVAYAGGMIYQIGSVGSSGSEVPFVDAYDPLTDTWTSAASMPTTLASYGAATVNGIIYVFGNDNNNTAFYAYQYDPSNNAWTSAGQINEPRSGFSAVAGSDGMIYIIGGMDNAGSYKLNVQVYDPATNFFDPNLQLPMLYGLSDFGATLGDNGNIYVVGGNSGFADSTTFLEFNPATYTWVDLSTPLPVAKSFVKAAVRGGKIYAVGGTANNGQVTRDVYEYDPQAASPAWVVRTSLLDTAETNANVISGLTSANGHLYAMGNGYNQEFTIGLEAQVVAVPSLTDVYVDDTVTVDLTIQNATDLYAMQATCTVDPTVLTVQDGTFGTLFDQAYNLVGSNTADPVAGTWTGAISQRRDPSSVTLPVTGGGTFATLSFTAAVAGSTTFNCTPLLSDQDGFTEPYTFTGTTITVQALTIVVNGTALYQGRLDHTGIQVTFTLNGNSEGPAVTGSAGTFMLTLNTAGSYDVRAEAASYLPNCDTLDLSGGQVDLLPTTLLGGDTNGDETIDIGDATLLAANFGLGVPPAPTEVDINADGLVNVQDLAILGSNYGLAGCQSW